MFRTTDIVLIAMMVGAAGFTYTTKHAAEAELNKLRSLEAAIRFEEETIDVLKADWSLLTQPMRLQKLVETYQNELQLVPVESHQFATIDELPDRQLTIEDLMNGTPDMMVEDDGATIDNTITSGVTQ